MTTDFLLGRDMQTSAPLSLKQTALIRDFDGLNEDGQATLLNVLAGLREVFPATRRVKKSKARADVATQKNRNGNNYFDIGGGNFNLNVLLQ